MNEERKKKNEMSDWPIPFLALFFASFLLFASIKKEKKRKEKREEKKDVDERTNGRLNVI